MQVGEGKERRGGKYKTTPWETYGGAVEEGQMSYRTICKELYTFFFNSFIRTQKYCAEPSEGL